MLNDFDITMSASLTALFFSMGQFAQATTSFGLSLFFFTQEEE